MIKVSDFFKDKNFNPFVLGAFFSRYIFSEDKKSIYTETYFKKSKYEKFPISEYKNDYLNTLNKISKPYNWTLTKTANTIFKATLSLENDLNLDEDSFSNKLYTYTISKILNDLFETSKKDFIRGFFEPRGSIDTTMKLLMRSDLKTD